MLELPLVVLSTLAACPALYLAGLTLGAVRQRCRPRSAKAEHSAEGHLAFVVPAHDEEGAIARTVKSLLTAADNNCSVHVIADNCGDRTAEAARAAGATVWERFDTALKSKGHALSWGFPQVELWCAEQGRPAAFYAVVDADATLSPNSVALARSAFANGGAVLQSEYLLERGTGFRMRLVRLAFAAMNIVRGLGRLSFGLSDTLKGNGMWLKAEVLRELPWRAFSLAEDFEYSLLLTRSGRTVELLQGSRVSGLPAVTKKGEKDQRIRWESGRLSLVLQELPKAARALVQKPTGQNLDTTLELATPPLAFLVALQAGLFVIACATSAAAATWISLAGLALLAFHVASAVPLAGLPWSEFAVLIYAPFYVAWKVALLPKIWANRRAKTWIRTERLLLLLALASPTLMPARQGFSAPLVINLPAAAAATIPVNPRIFCVGYGPWIDKDDADLLAPRLVRWGGNTSSRFDLIRGNTWNAGKDYHFQPVTKGPASLWLDWVKGHRSAGRSVAFTLPLLLKTTDDDFRASVAKLKAAMGAGEHLYALDNEPFLWHETHADAQHRKITPAAFAKVWLHAARLVRAVDPEAVLTGPGLWGWKDLENLPPFLKAVLPAKDANGRYLLDVVSASLYPQNADLQAALSDITGHSRPAESTATKRRRVDTTANADDPSFVDPSWINRPVAYVPAIQRLIDSARENGEKNRPSPGIGIAEYNWGGAGDESGAQAQALLLLKWLKLGVHHACTFTWPPPGSPAGATFHALSTWLAPSSGLGPKLLADQDSLAPFLWLEESRAGQRQRILLLVTGVQQAVLAPVLRARVHSVDALDTAGTWQSLALSLLDRKLESPGLLRLRID